MLNSLHLPKRRDRGLGHRPGARSTGRPVYGRPHGDVNLRGSVRPRRPGGGGLALGSIMDGRERAAGGLGAHGSEPIAVLSPGAMADRRVSCIPTAPALSDLFLGPLNPVQDPARGLVRCESVCIEMDIG